MMGGLRLGDGIAFMCEVNSGLALSSQHHALRGCGGAGEPEPRAGGILGQGQGRAEMFHKWRN